MKMQAQIALIQKALNDAQFMADSMFHLQGVDKAKEYSRSFETARQQFELHEIIVSEIVKALELTLPLMELPVVKEAVKGPDYAAAMAALRNAAKRAKL
jgi:hypothetical protein